MAKRKSAPSQTPKEARPKREALLADGERYGVFDSRKVYSQHALARILGMADHPKRCSQFVLNRLFRAGVPFEGR